MSKETSLEKLKSIFVAANGFTTLIKPAFIYGKNKRRLGLVLENNVSSHIKESVGPI
jgi:hypothetical protein